MYIDRDWLIAAVLFALLWAYARWLTVQENRAYWKRLDEAAREGQEYCQMGWWDASDTDASLREQNWATAARHRPSMIPPRSGNAQ